MSLCDIYVIKNILKQNGFHFSKSLGQNFLINQYVPEKIAAECGADKNSFVLEIGPGIGCLTNELSKIAKKVTAIEIDRSLFPILKQTLSHCDNVNIIHGDILKTDIKSICSQNFEGKKIYACANLPYYITTPVISTLIESQLFSSITIMVQKEMAQRICAPSGTSNYSAFSIYVQYYTNAKILFEVPSDCFIPQPKVDSAVIKLDILQNPSVNTKNEQLFFSIVKAAFNQRRKTLVNALSTAFNSKLEKAEIISLVESCNLSSQIRGEKLTLEQYALLADKADQILKEKQTTYKIKAP